MSRINPPPEERPRSDMVEEKSCSRLEVDFCKKFKTGKTYKESALGLFLPRLEDPSFKKAACFVSGSFFSLLNRDVIFLLRIGSPRTLRAIARS